MLLSWEDNSYLMYNVTTVRIQELPDVVSVQEPQCNANLDENDHFTTDEHFVSLSVGNNGYNINADEDDPVDASANLCIVTVLEINFFL